MSDSSDATPRTSAMDRAAPMVVASSFWLKVRRAVYRPGDRGATVMPVTRMGVGRLFNVTFEKLPIELTTEVNVRSPTRVVPTEPLLMTPYRCELTDEPTCWPVILTVLIVERPSAT